jgi:4-hydroxybenzoate polyprenyltransferase
MTTPDALPNSWISRAPDAVQPYLRLARFDRPIGTWLLFWPCVWGVLLAAAPLGLLQFKMCVLLGVGSIAMRSAGCVWNDILDRDLDAQVERTRGRPLPSGDVTVFQAVLFMLLLCSVGLGVLLLLPHPAQLVAFCAVPLVALYPLMKRITWWPQAWLGLTFNWGALVGYASIAGQLDVVAVLLYVGGLFWTLGYDTIYAMQDVVDDELAGVKSSARRLGAAVPGAVLCFYGVSMLMIFSALLLSGRLSGYGLAVLAFAAHLVWQSVILKRLNGAVSSAAALKLFRSNFVAGGLLAANMLIFRVFIG